MPAKTTLEILDELLEDHTEALTARAVEAFTDWRDRLRAQKRPFQLSDAQRAWIYGVAERCGVIGAAPSENLFSQMSPERQAEERRKASRVRLPWEK